jgi:hypothetical protein
MHLENYNLKEEFIPKTKFPLGNNVLDGNVSNCECCVWGDLCLSLI